MERRDFLGGTAVGAAALAAGCGASNLGRSDQAATRGEVIRVHRQLDHGLALLQQTHFLQSSLQARGATEANARAYARHHEPTARDALRSLFVVGVYRDLPGDLQRDPSLHDRLLGFAPALDRSVLSLATTMAETSPTRRDEIRRALRRNATIPAEIGELIDQQSGAFGIAARTRANMRSTVGQVAWRMANQSPSLLMDEYVSKVHRIAGWQGPRAAAQRQLATAMAAQAATDPRWGEPPPRATVWTGPAASPEPARPERSRPGTGVIRAGLIVGGIGVAVFGLGLLLEAGNGGEIGPGIFVATLGAVGVLVGLVVLLVGGIISLSASDDPRQW